MRKFWIFKNWIPTYTLCIRYWIFLAHFLWLLLGQKNIVLKSGWCQTTFNYSTRAISKKSIFDYFSTFHVPFWGKITYLCWYHFHNSLGRYSQISTQKIFSWSYYLDKPANFCYMIFLIFFKKYIFNFFIFLNATDGEIMKPFHLFFISRTIKCFSSR